MIIITSRAQWQSDAVQSLLLFPHRPGAWAKFSGSSKASNHWGNKLWAKGTEEAWNTNMNMISKATMLKMARIKKGEIKSREKRWQFAKPCHWLLPSSSTNFEEEKTKMNMTKITTIKLDMTKMKMTTMQNLDTGSSPPPAPSTAPTDRRSTKPAFENIWGTRIQRHSNDFLYLGTTWPLVGHYLATIW